MKGKKQIHSHLRDDWTTPRDLFDRLNREFIFNLDVAASRKNALCANFFDESSDALMQAWPGVSWCNPPYSKWQQFAEKAQFEIRSGAANCVVMLLAARTDTKAFHEYIYNKPNVEIRFIKGRLKFGGSQHGAPFPSMIVIWRRAK